MEYLTLQDIPHHFSPLRSAAMSSPEDSSSRNCSLPSIASVCGPLFPFNCPPSSSISIAPLPQVSSQEETEKRTLFETAPAVLEPEPPCARTIVCPSRGPVASEATVVLQHVNNVDKGFRNSSPPFQPGESHPKPLPSFQSLLDAAKIEPSPPTTPSRLGTSMDNSPVDHSGAKPRFEEPVWGDFKRRRVDTVAENCYHRLSDGSMDYAPHDSRRTNMLDQPSNSSYHTPKTSNSSSGGPPNLVIPLPHHHRPSLPYPAGHLAGPRLPSPPPQARQSLLAYQARQVGSYSSTPIPAPSLDHHGVQYHLHRPSYYDEPHLYDRRHHDPYMSRDPRDDRRYSITHHPGYLHEPSFQSGHAYSQYTFQSALGMDQTQFARKRRGNLPKEATSTLKSWFAAHRESPYPTEDEKVSLCQQTGLTLNQVSNWFINARRRAPQKEQSRQSRDGTTDEVGEAFP